MTLMFSALHFIYFSVCCGTITYAEFNKPRTFNQITSNKFFLFLHSLPHFFLTVLVVAVVNNAGIGFGYGGVISWFVGFFGEWFTVGYFVAITLLAAVTLPACEKYILAH